MGPSVPLLGSDRQLSINRDCTYSLGRERNRMPLPNTRMPGVSAETHFVDVLPALQSF